MPTERYFLDDHLNANETYQLEGSECHHLTHVMRTKIGQTVEIVNGKGSLAQAIVKEIKKNSVGLQVDSVSTQLANPSKIILAQALPKPNRLDFILEKGTELGVDAFWIFPGQLSVKKELFPNQIERARLLTIAAMKQCGRLFLPEILFYPSVMLWESLPSSHSSFFGDVNPLAPLFIDRWKSKPNSLDSTLFIVGPESGLTDKETQQLKDLGANGVKLHPNILRTETASLLAIGLIAHWNMPATD